jgi:hypothetical protein
MIYHQLMLYLLILLRMQLTPARISLQKGDTNGFVCECGHGGTFESIVVTLLVYSIVDV